MRPGRRLAAGARSGYFGQRYTCGVCRVGGHVIVLNHFLSENRFLARTERLISPLTVHIGFKADVDLSSFIARSGFQPVSIERVSVPKLWSLLTFQKQ